MSYKKIFHASNWFNATPEERLEALQSLENEYARLQGRSPAIVRILEDPEVENAQFIKGTPGFTRDIIEIEKELIDFSIGGNKKFSFRVTNVFACHALLHEGRHAYQHYAIDHPEIHPDKEQVQKWRENNEVYYCRPKHYYHFQPVELDAEKFARNEMKKIFRELEKEFGEDYAFQRYKQYIEAMDRFYEKLADELGKDVESVIQSVESRIHQVYQARERINKELEALNTATQERKELINLTNERINEMER
ncbi:hypothetical protein NYE37_13740 [Thermoactinomyces sp. FSL K6-2592]|jgi:DNA repair ATPase RecN|uniref:hypothetical protein n=1 Tax=Thermoactinomyces sp. FSL K6-2592 TaxID=2975347 RepID=UPI0030FBCFA1